MNEGLQNQGEKESGDRVIEGRRGVLGGRNIQLMVLACTAGGTSPENESLPYARTPPCTPVRPSSSRTPFLFPYSHIAVLPSSSHTIVSYFPPYITAFRITSRRPNCFPLPVLPSSFCTSSITESPSRTPVFRIGLPDPLPPRTPPHTPVPSTSSALPLTHAIFATRGPRVRDRHDSISATPVEMMLLTHDPATPTARLA